MLGKLFGKSEKPGRLAGARVPDGTRIYSCIEQPRSEDEESDAFDYCSVYDGMNTIFLLGVIKIPSFFNFSVMTIFRQILPVNSFPNFRRDIIICCL